VHRPLDSHRVRSWEEFFDVPLSKMADTLDEAATHFPLMMGLPGKLPLKPRRGGSPLLPQVFRRWKIECTSCSQVNDVREFALPMRVHCKACGHELMHVGS